LTEFVGVYSLALCVVSAVNPHLMSGLQSHNVAQNNVEGIILPHKN